MNWEKWDAIMFSLLEGEIPAEDKKELLNKIESNNELKLRWEQWRQTTFSQETLIDQNFISSLKKKEKRKALVWLPISVGLFAILGIAYYIQNASNQILINPITSAVYNGEMAMDSIVDSSRTNRVEQDNPVLITNIQQNEKKKEEIQDHKVKIQRVEDSNLLPVNEPQVQEMNSKIHSLTKIDSAVIEDLKTVIAEGKTTPKRLRGNDIKVSIQNHNKALVKNTDTGIKKILNNYEIASSRVKYSVEKVLCDTDKYCYTLVITSTNSITQIKL